ncbi:MAG: hypothetical protein LH478_03870 [Chitinophagaceae bacterium]|nr:hypothetical protein [Chitinophagaceae bacterium]
MSRPNLINSKTVFGATLIVLPTLSLMIYLTGIRNHRTLYLNSLISTTILSIVFFSFITIGLYNGWKLQDNYGNFLHKFPLWKKPSSSALDVSGFDFGLIETESFMGAIGAVFLWIILALLGSIIFWAIGAIFWATVLLVGGMLYWIVFRAYRMIFRNSAKCKGDIMKSAGTALLFTFFYNCWIYVIIFGTHYLNR